MLADLYHSSHDPRFLYFGLTIFLGSAASYVLYIGLALMMKSYRSKSRNVISIAFFVLCTVLTSTFN
jgi:hypothetical protein